MKRLITMTLVAAVAVGASVGASGILATDAQPTPLLQSATPLQQAPPTLNGLATLRAMQASFRDVADQALPVVVKIDTTTVITQRRGRSRFSAPGQPRQFEQPGGTGSGVIVSRAGNEYFVLTNNHVIENTTAINITLDDGSEFVGSLVGRDPRQDIALVAFESRSELPVATLGDSDALQVGDWVLAIGSPFGFQSTVTTGIVSALGRETAGGLGANIAEYIQTDAAINPGNSGGALVNLDGELIGINTWITSRNGSNVGLGFALPINGAKRAILEFQEYGEVRYGYLGAFVSEATDDIEVALDVAGTPGAVAWSIIVDSPAAQAGLRPGDFVIGVNGVQVGTSAELIRAVGSLEPNADAEFELIRNGRERSIDVRVALRDDSDEGAQDWPGIFPAELTDGARSQLGVDNRVRGIVARSVTENSPTAAAGVRPGDIIIKVNGRPVRDVAEFYQAFGSMDSGEYEIELIRQDEERTVRATL
jgi:Do/DeqQ family serine protease